MGLFLFFLFMDFVQAERFKTFFFPPLYTQSLSQYNPALFLFIAFEELFESPCSIHCGICAMTSSGFLEE